MLEGVDPHAVLVFGSGVVIVIVATLGSVIKAWIKRGTGTNLTENREFLAALREFKEKTDRRLSNIEEIITENESVSAKRLRNQPKTEKRQQTLDIELEDEADRSETESAQKNKLKNMLNQ